MRKIGFVVNPIAGMGGKVGLKGTDGMIDEAIKRKAKIVAVKKAEEFLSHLKNFDIYTASHLMGENECKKFDITAKVVYKSKIPSNSEDTKNACKEFLKYGVDIIIFVGGDGTARDVYSIVKKNVAILGIPAGVKMYSGVFAFTPYEGAEIINNFEGFEEKEIMDIDENAFRKGEFKVSLIGYAIVPRHEKIQNSKGILPNEGKEEIAEWFIDNMESNTIYIIGGGSTTWEIKKAIGIKGSFLGIDVICNKKILCRDSDEKCILKNLNRKAKIVVSPLGGHGFIFGRGNQPISSNVIKKVGLKNIIIVATKDKLARLESLKVDTGDEKLNERMRGYIKVITGYNESKIMKII